MPPAATSSPSQQPSGHRGPLEPPDFWDPQDTSPKTPTLADLESEAELEGRWTNRSLAQASREHQGGIGKHGSLDPGPCPGHSSGQAKTC